MKSIIVILLLLSISNSLNAQSAFMSTCFTKYANKPTKEVFLDAFPYKEYLDKIEFTDFKTLQTDRYFVYQQFGDGDDFLYHLGDCFIKNYPVTISKLEPKITIGEQYLNPKKGDGFNKGVNEIYQIMGYFLLGKVAQKIEEEIHNGNFDPGTSINNQIIKRLESNRVYVSVEESTMQKIGNTIKKGRFGYLTDRLQGVLTSYFALYIGLLGGFWFIIVSIVVIFGLVVMFKSSDILKIVSMIIFLILIILPAFFKGKKKANTSQTTKIHANFTQNPHKTFYGGAISIFKILDKNKSEIGISVWMERPLVKANYFAHENVPQKYINFKSNNKIVLAATGGFTNTSKQPEGFTMENGNIVNAVLMPDRHGLVSIFDGGVVVMNLKNDIINLRTSAKTSYPIDNPTKSLIAYSKLLEWCKKNKATLFQTQLLAHGDSMLIKVSKAKIEQRERRLLALFSDRKTGKVNHAIFNITTKYNLAEVAEEVFSIISSRNKKVEAILNLDVGQYDILEVYDDNGNLLPEVKGPVSVNSATNLIFYSK